MIRPEHCPNPAAYCLLPAAYSPRCYTPAGAAMWMEDEIGFTMSFWDALRQRFQGQHTLANIVFGLFWSAVTICVAVIAAKYLKQLVRRALIRARLPLNIVALAGNGTTLLVVIVCAAVILTIFGIPTSAVVTSFGLATAGIVLAFQDVLKNFIAGIYLLVERPFTI